MSSNSVEAIVLGQWNWNATSIIKHARLTTLGCQQELNFGYDLACVICVLTAVPDFFEFVFFVGLLVSDRELMWIFVAFVADNAADRLALLLSPKNFFWQAAKYAAALLSFWSLGHAAWLWGDFFLFIISVRDVKAIDAEINWLWFQLFVVLY